MPGIPRSKGCVNCRERKVKCDLGRPTCARCAESRRTCKGYRKSPTLFVNCTSAPLVSENTSTPVKQPNAGPVLVDHLLALFLHDYLPKSHNKITHNHQYGLSWAQYMPSLCYKSQVLNQSLAAVSLAIVGRSHQDERLFERSFEVYGLALTGLRDVIRRQGGKHSQDTLASMMAMTTYELWQPTFKSGHGWMAHVQGASKIMESLGPISKQSPLDACLLSHFRTSSIFDALGRRKPYFWGPENWRKSRSEAPRLNDLLLDIAADIPALFEQTDLLLDNKIQEPEFTLRRIGVMQRYTQFHEQLQHWYEGAQEVTPGPIYYESTYGDSLTDMGDFPFKPRLIQFFSLPVAQLVIIYWTCRSMLYVEMGRLTSAYNSSTSHPLSSTPIPEQPPNAFDASAIAFADLAIRAEPFCTHHSHGMSGVQSVAFTMWAIQHHVYFGRSLEKEAYCNRRALEIGRGKGLYFLSQVTNLSCEDYKEMGRKGLKLEVLDDEEISYFDMKSLENFVYRKGEAPETSSM